MITELPILTFHSLDKSGSVISVDPIRFEMIMRQFKDKGYVAIRFAELVHWIIHDIPINSRAFVITFDDGYENLYHHAFPLLNELGYPATVFLTTGHCGKLNDWHTQTANIPRLPILNWEQIREMADYGCNFQSHSHTHPYLFQLKSEELMNELTHSKKMIEDRLGKPVDFFAYPYGFHNRGEDLPVRDVYDAACSDILNVCDKNENQYVLPRIDMYYFSSRVSRLIFHSPLNKSYISSRRAIRKMKQACLRN